MNEFFSKIKDAFPKYHCCMYNNDEITFTPNHFFNVSLKPIVSFKFENFIEELDVFFKKNTCPYEHVSIKFKILIKDWFKEYNCYGFLITRTGIDDIGIDNVIVKDFNKEEIIDLIMKDVNKESFMHIIDIDVEFS